MEDKIALHMVDFGGRLPDRRVAISTEPDARPPSDRGGRQNAARTEVHKHTGSTQHGPKREKSKRNVKARNDAQDQELTTENEMRQNRTKREKLI